MATRRDDAKSAQQVSDDVHANVTRTLREKIEAEIERFGRVGFTVHAENLVELWSHGSAYRDVALAAVNDVVEEYKSAGWNVSCQLKRGHSETAPSDLSSDGARILVTFY